MSDERPAIHAYLTIGNHEVWHTVAEEAGVSLSGFLEALAADMKEFPPDEKHNHPRWSNVIKYARKVDAARRRRGDDRETEERRAMHAYLTKEAHDTWHTVSEEAGVSLSGFLEALAADMKEFPPDEKHNHPRWSNVIKSTRRIDAQRRRR